MFRRLALSCGVVFLLTSGCFGQIRVFNINTFHGSTSGQNCTSTPNNNASAPDWGWQWNANPLCLNSPGTLVTSPSLDGQARELDWCWGTGCSPTTGGAFGGALFHADANATGNLDFADTSFTWSAWFYYTATSTINQFEFDLNQVIADGDTIIYAAQCDLTTSGGVWEFSNHWTITSTVACPRAQWTINTWHQISIAAHRASSCTTPGTCNVTFDSVSFDGTKTVLTNALCGGSCTHNSADSLGWSPSGLLLPNVQFGVNNSANGTNTAYVDLLSITSNQPATTLSTTGTGWTWTSVPGPTPSFCKVVDVAVVDDEQSLQHGCDGSHDQNVVCSKYKGSACSSVNDPAGWVPWAQAMSTQLQQYGFNSVGMYSYRYLQKFPTGGIPYVPTYGLGGYLMQNSVHNGFGPYNVKDIMWSTNYSGMHCAPVARGSAPGAQADPYDPNFQLGASALLNGDFITGWDFSKASYVIPEEADYLFSMDSCCGNINSHPDGMLVLAESNPSVSVSRNSFTWSDHELYAKQAMEAYLQAKYTTIAALNTAWFGTTVYTTFGTSDAGGLAGITSGAYASWGTGTGFLDENGTNIIKSGLSCGGASGNGLQESDSWAPTGHTQIQTDIDGFINSFAATYAQKVQIAWKAACGSTCPPEFMPFYDGPANSNDSVYAGAAPYVDGLWIAPQYDTTPTVIGARVQQMLNNSGNTPFIFGQYYAADPDAWPNIACNGNVGSDCQTSQALRGARWVAAYQAVQRLKNPSGKYPIVGFSHYGLYDDCSLTSAAQDIGIASLNANFYDGSEATTATSSGSCPTTPTAETIPYICFDGTNYEGLTQAGTTGSSPSWNTTLGGQTTTGGAIFFNEGPYTPYPENDASHSGNFGNALLPITQFQTGNLCDPAASTAPVGLSPLVAQ